MPSGPLNQLELDNFKLRKINKKQITDCPDCGCKKEDLKLEYFCTELDTWMSLCGREGYKLICPKCGKIIRNFITCMN